MMTDYRFQNDYIIPELNFCKCKLETNALIILLREIIRQHANLLSGWIACGQ